MTDAKKLEITLTALQKIASVEKPKHVDDDSFSPYDWSGGNFDDAYSLGWGSGEWSQAVVAIDALERINEACL